MSWTLFILILLAAVAVIGGLNTVCEFCERMHRYYKAYKSRQKKEINVTPTVYYLPANLNRHAVFGFARNKTDLLSATHRDIDHFLPAGLLKKRSF